MIVAIPEYPFNTRAVDGGNILLQCKRIWFTDGRRNGEQWKGSDDPREMHPDDFWQTVYDTVSSRVCVTIVSPNAGDLLTSSGFWVWADRGYFRLGGERNSGVIDDRSNSPQHTRRVGRCILGGPPDIVHTYCKQGSVLNVSLRNYTQESWERLIGYTCSTNVKAGTGQVASSDSVDCPSTQCIAATRFMRGLISRWVRDDCGPWRDTTAQLSVSLWKRRFYDEKVTKHAHPEAVKLERSASYGGRNQCWFFGDIGNPDITHEGEDVRPETSNYPSISGTVYRCDISSQYPAILATELFPTRLIGVADNISVADLEALNRYYGCIADVTIRTERDEYPRKRSGESSYPVGEFRTAIVGPECIRAIECGEVKRCHQVAYYQLGAPLCSYARWLIGERIRCRESFDPVGEQFAKSLSTAIGGKFSQRSTVRTPVCDAFNPAGAWGPWTRTDPDGTVRRFVSIAGVSFEEKDSPVASKLLSAVYCFLTAYGRAQMTRIREGLRPCKPFAQCTDGIWVGETALDRLQSLGLSVDRTPGMMRVVSQHYYARFFGANHYYIDGRWTLSGYRAGARVETDHTVTEWRDLNPVRSVAWKAPMALRRQYLKRSLVKIGDRESIGSDGWLIPRSIGI